jgi:DNA-binding winged helix-turn-helix (wHTH) protein
MIFQQIHSYSKMKYLFGFTLLLSVAMVCVAFNLSNNDDFELAKQQILLRKIGHELLLRAGDSTSRVLPVKKINTNEYQIKFENELSFQADSLVKIVKNTLTKDQLSDGYIVNVRNCMGLDIVFGYSMAGNVKDNVIPCTGRTQPKGCYLIEIKFQNTGLTPTQKGYLIGGIPFLAIVGLLFTNAKGRRKVQIKNNTVDEQFKIGQTFFDFKNRKLIFAKTLTKLTVKETRLLLILAKEQNVIIDRSRLQKEIWEDEGVIVGRSLDVFISKLRKKLEADLSIQLKNIHGRGYKLEIEN